ncbi:tRNA pseudouridine synthase-like 1-like isoform X2 [Hibiscus syriacus]|uniref:tRNA pseudouridine synthase n=1 Tax=Hibiscus syriacus TaxID=106335 RepID=A0A6A2Z3X3_HIBSY|nr:tRNA pseudouridine synthase-like 1-like isoform X2 [Hibiscus syriacus]
MEMENNCFFSFSVLIERFIVILSVGDHVRRLQLPKGCQAFEVHIRNMEVLSEEVLPGFPEVMRCRGEVDEIGIGLGIENLGWLGIGWFGAAFPFQGTRSRKLDGKVSEKALVRITKLEREHLHFVGASRTDTGVHAWGQVAHFITPFNYDSLETVHAALNGLLPSDIRVREIAAARPEFHARFSAKSKVYHYKIYNDSIMDPFQRHHAYHSYYKLNTAAMREAAKLFIGKHDFSAFVNVSRNDRVPNPVKTIFRFEAIEMLEVEGSGFLYRQVRNMVALLVQIGKEAIPADIVPKILATQDRRELAKFALSAPPHGLCLVSVKYNEEHLRLPSECPTTSFGRYHTISKCKLLQLTNPKF